DDSGLHYLQAARQPDQISLSRSDRRTAHGKARDRAREGAPSRDISRLFLAFASIVTLAGVPDAANSAWRADDGMRRSFDEPPARIHNTTLLVSIGASFLQY